MSEERENRGRIIKGRRAAVYICRAARYLLLLLMFLAGMLSALPNLLGYRAYIIISGSMEPTVPVGSVVYAKSVEPEKIQAGDIIVFYGGRDGDAVTTHRVAENRTKNREFITRGDANADNDMLPRPYESLIGRVEFTVPFLGRLLIELSGKGKRWGLLGTLAAAMAALYFLEDRLRHM